MDEEINRMTHRESVVTFPFYTLSGTPFELGQQYGEVARRGIRHYLDGMLERFSAESNLSLDTVRQRLEVFAEDYERYAPHLLREIEGVAAGAGVTPEEALLCRTRWDIAEHAGCTSFVAQPEATDEGLMIGGQVKDVPPKKIDEVVLVHVEPENKPAFIGYSYFGMLEGPGFNAAGLCRFENSIYVEGASRSVPVHLLKRMLTECISIDECLDVLTRLQGDNRLGLAAAMALGDATGRACSLEIAAGKFRVVEPEKGVIARANNLLAKDLQHLERAHQQVEFSDTFTRTRRIQSLLSGEGLTLARACSVLSDHEGHPASICRHKEMASTVAALVCIPAARKLYVTRGNPCTNPWTLYRLRNSGTAYAVKQSTDHTES